jgi:predicted metal-binding protein
MRTDVRLTASDDRLCQRCDNNNKAGLAALRRGETLEAAKKAMSDCQTAAESRRTRRSTRTSTVKVPQVVSTPTTRPVVTPPTPPAACSPSTRRDPVVARLPTANERTDSTHDWCPMCSEPVLVTDILVCDVCDCNVHSICAGMSETVLATLMSIVEVTGWVCPACRKFSRRQRRVAKWDDSKLADDVAAVKTEMRAIRADFESYRKARPEPPVIWPSVPSPNPARAAVAPDLESELADKQSRRHNIVVSGLPPVDGTDDADLFSHMCETNLPVKPAVVRESCRRIGRAQSGKVQPLLVTLVSEESAAQLVRCAPCLRKSADVLVRSTIYINPDRTPAEARAAYEERVKRRALGLGVSASQSTADFERPCPGAGTSVKSPLSVSAPVFLPSSSVFPPPASTTSV